ncbi:MAG: hypothetical protein HQK60_19875 [Deltaproteobacteria bacterium]|nr:hypothetical protein [Deltaproteobacteria bacterium]
MTNERWEHIETEHPELSDELEKVRETLLVPDKIVKSRTDKEAELFYRNYETTHIGHKFMCVVVKVRADDSFMITAYFTDTIKKGEVLWERT